MVLYGYVLVKRNYSGGVIQKDIDYNCRASRRDIPLKDKQFADNYLSKGNKSW